MSFGYSFGNSRSIHLVDKHNTLCKISSSKNDISGGSVVEAVHPLKCSRNELLSEDFQMSLNTLRDIQGIHAPLRIAMEMKAFEKTGRLPFLPSSNLSTDVLLGKDDWITFSDILYTPDVYEHQHQPYAVMEMSTQLSN